MASKSDKVIDNAVSHAYAVSCSGIQVSIWDLTKIHEEGKKAYLAGKRDGDLEIAIREFVETIRKN